MRLLVDENVDVKVVRLLRGLGHDAKRGPSGLKNGAVMRLAISEDRILVTRDADFTDAARFPPSPALRSFLKSVAGLNLAGRLFVVDEAGYVESA